MKKFNGFSYNKEVIEALIDKDNKIVIYDASSDKHKEIKLSKEEIELQNIINEALYQIIKKWFSIDI